MTGTETSTDSISDDLSAAFSTESPSAEVAQPADATAQAHPVSGEAIAALEPPKHWNEGDRGLFSKAPREIQQRWIDREKEQQKGLDTKFQEIAGFRREKEQLDELLTPYTRDLELQGISRPQFIGSLVGAHKFLLENPPEAIKWLAQQYGVDLTSLTETASPNPQLDKLNQGFQSLDKRLNGFLTAQQQAEHKANFDKVTSFAEAKDEKGQPLHPFFDEVAADVLALMKSGIRDLDAAYLKAVRMNDEVFAKVQASKAAQTEVESRKRQQAEIDKAKRAGVTSQAREATNGSTRPSTLKEDLEAGFASWAT